MTNKITIDKQKPETTTRKHDFMKRIKFITENLLNIKEITIENDWNTKERSNT